MDPDPGPGSRIRILDPNPAIFVVDLKDAKKTNFLNSFSAHYFLKVHLHHFSKSQIEVTKQ
jgi:hypothetical protein